ncbi:hypothetical protein [Bacillus sp. REN3]|uniref:hypothetical protein n=1 Tax=Bacillus sp. REN3 TaxID=2802440 RepID=UPI001AEDB474|nr:hypothetical protein [Bacillus sp. REN3]
MIGDLILYDLEEQRQFRSVQNKIINDTYTDQDFILLLGLLKRHADKMDLKQTKKLCELVQYLYTIEREERLLNDLLDIVNGMFYKNE